MESVISIVSYSNAFFGAFFGYWVKSMLDPLINLSTPDWTAVVLEVIIVLLAISLHIAGLWKSRELCSTTPVGEALSTYKYNWLSLLVFGVAMIVTAYYYLILTFPSIFGGLLYLWWVVSVFVALALAESD